MTTTFEALDAISDGSVTVLAETDRASELAAFAENILSTGTGTNFSATSEVNIDLAPDVVYEHAARLLAGIGDIALR